jgi:hypothetical protein
MSTRGAGRVSPHLRRATLTALAASVALAVAGCGSKDFANEPRPPAPLEVSAKVGSHRVVVSPNKFGAGLVNFTVANLSDSPVRFTVSGPRDGATGDIEPGAPAYLKLAMPTGVYQATAGDTAKARPASIKVGPTRKTSQNQLLLP